MLSFGTTYANAVRTRGFVLIPLLLGAVLAGCREPVAGSAPRTPVQAVVISGSGQVLEWGYPAPEPLKVKVIDVDGAGVPGIDVTWSLSSGGGSIEYQTTVTDQDGMASTRYAANTELGVSTVRVTSQVAGLQPAVFALGIGPVVITGHSSLACTPPNGAERPLVVVEIKNEYLFRRVTGLSASGAVVPYDPECAEFISASMFPAGDSPYFTFAEFTNQSYHSWAVITDRLRIGANATRAAYGKPLIISNGYRCPDKQHDVKPNEWFAGGRHMHGDAVDFETGNDLATWQAIKAAAKSAGACVEPLESSTKNHVHADWRPVCPNGW